MVNKLCGKRYQPTGKGYRGCGEETEIAHPYVGFAERVQSLAEAARNRGDAACSEEFLALAKDSVFRAPKLREEYSHHSPRFMRETLHFQGRCRGIEIHFESSWDWRSERFHDHHLAETLEGIVTATCNFAWECDHIRHKCVPIGRKN